MGDARDGEEHGGRNGGVRAVDLDGISLVVLAVLQSVRTLGVRDRAGAFRFLLDKGGPEFFPGVERLAWQDRRRADRVEITFRASKADQKHLGAVVSRVGEPLRILLHLLDMYPELESQVPLMQGAGEQGWKVVSRSEVTRALRLLVSSLGMNPEEFALHSGRIGGATQLARMGATEIQIQRAGRWKSSAFMVWGRGGQVCVAGTRKHRRIGSRSRA